MSVHLNTPRLDELIAARGMTHEAFANWCGITPATLSRARNGRPLRTTTLSAIAQGLVRAKPLSGLEGLITAMAPKQ